MKRIGWLLTVIAVMLSLAGCARNRPVILSLEPTPATPSQSATNSATTSAAVAASPSADVSAATGREQAILAAVPAALETAARATAEMGTKVPDLSAATPKITSYILVARAGKLDYAFEVRGDGQAYELYEYPKKPNPAKLMGGELPAEEAALLREPMSDREIAAATAVKAVMDRSPSGGAEVFIYGYNIGFTDKSGRPVASPEGGAFQISVDPNGKLAEL